MHTVQIDKVTYKLLKKQRTSIDKLILFVGILGPLVTLAQVYKIFSEQNAAGVSLLSWTFYLFAAFVSLSYAVVHRLKPLVISNILWIAVDVVVVVGIIKYN